MNVHVNNVFFTSDVTCFYNSEKIMHAQVKHKLPSMELTECNAFDRLLNSTSTITSMVTKAMITTMSTIITAMAMVATLEAPPPPPMDCAVVASGLPVVPRFVVAVVESPSVISGPPAVVMSVVPSSGVLVFAVDLGVVVEGLVTSIVVASMVVTCMVVASMVVVSMVVASIVVASIVVVSMVVASMVVASIVVASTVVASMVVAPIVGASVVTTSV